MWKAEWPGAMSVAFMAKRNGDWIRSTPAYDGDSLYVAGIRDEETWGHLAVCGNQLFIRELNGISTYRWQ